MAAASGCPGRRRRGRVEIDGDIGLDCQRCALRARLEPRHSRGSHNNACACSGPGNDATATEDHIELILRYRIVTAIAISNHMTTDTVEQSERARATRPPAPSPSKLSGEESDMAGPPTTVSGHHRHRHPCNHMTPVLTANRCRTAAAVLQAARRHQPSPIWSDGAKTSRDSRS